MNALQPFRLLKAFTLASEDKSRNKVTTNVRTVVKSPLTHALLAINVAVGNRSAPGLLPGSPRQAGSAVGWLLGACRDALPQPSPPAFPSALPVPTPVTDIRTDKVEQKSISLSWQEPGFPTNSTEYEVKYYEKVWLWEWNQHL